MKKLFLSLMALAMTAFAFTSCEDVPQPYDTPTVNVDTTKVVPSGTGTADDPYNVAMAKQLVNSGTYPTGEVYVKGVITSLQNGTYTFNEQFHNYTYCINDKLETAGQFVVFRGKNLGNTDFTSADELQVGDTVIVCGKFTTHNNEPQFDQGNYLYYLNGKKAESNPNTPGVAKGTGTEADPFNAVAALNAAKALDASGKLEGVYVKGKISKIDEIDTGNFGNATYYVSDDGTTSNQFEIYRGYYLNGEKFTSADQLKVGDEVVVKGDIVNFNGNTPEMTQRNQIVSINGKGSQSAPAGLNATFNEGQDDFTIENVSLSEGLDYVWKYNAKTATISGYMKASAYKKANLAAQSRLVSPAFSLEGLTKATLSFQHAGKFFGKGEGDMAKEIQVLASTDGKTWTKLTISAYPSGNDWTFVDATCDLSAFAGKETVYIAFQYTSTADAAPTWEVKNVVVK